MMLQIMKQAIFVFIILLVSALMPAVASASTDNPSVGNLWPEGPHLWSSNANSRSMEDKFAEALQALKASRKAGTQKSANAPKAGSPLLGQEQKALNNSTSKVPLLNSSNSSAQASLANNSSIDATEAAPLLNGSDQQKVGANSSGSFQGFYGLTASRHEMGKSDIRSRMFLSGDFDVDKTVSFTDRGV